MQQLYTKTITANGRTRYEPYTQPPVQSLSLTEAQCVTAAGALGTMLLMVFERNMPAHKKVPRKIRAVELAILDLFRGCGETIDPQIADLFCATWDKTMQELTA